jgi:PBP/GOBP family
LFSTIVLNKKNGKNYFSSFSVAASLLRECRKYSRQIKFVATHGRPFDQEFEVPKYMKDAIDILHKMCMEKSGATMDELSKCQSGQVPDHPTVKCYLACLYETLEVFDENDHVDLKQLSITMPDSVKKIIEHVGSVCAKIGQA